jgi:hypothetical protein
MVAVLIPKMVPSNMPVSFARPDVANLVFQVFGRSVHPELFRIYAQTELRQSGYSATIRINEAGHVLTFRHGEQTLSEVTAARETPLPQRKRIVSHRLRGHRNESMQCEGGIQYHVSFQLDQLDPDEFAHFHQELLADSCHCRVSHQFGAKNRLYPMPLSFLQIEDTPHSLLVHSFHTFPDNCAVVKIQSLFEI